MKIFSKEVKIPIFLALIFTGILITLVLIYWYSSVKDGTKLGDILVGLICGFIVAIMQLLLSYFEYSAIQKYKDLKLKDITSHRSDRKFYQKLIEKSKSRVRVMGVTAIRFLQDFCDRNSIQNESKILIDAMNRGVIVQILVPSKENLATDKDMRNFDTTKSMIEEIIQENANIEIRYFDHPASHSIFEVDELCIVGPVFPGVSSKDTPSIFFESKSQFAQLYLKYFDDEWNKAQG